jgi:PAS domain S-box-containing protein
MRTVVAAHRPEVVLLDQRLPDGEGLAGARELLADDPDIAIILLTGMADPQLDEEAERAGVTDFLVKHEIDGRILARAVRYALRRREDRRDLRRSETRYRDLVRALPDTGAFVVDAQLRFLMVGGDALDGAGLDADAIVGADATELLADADGPPLLDHYRAALAGRESALEHTSSAGRTYRTTFRPLAVEAGAVTEAMAVTFDITDQLRVATELQRAQALAHTGSWWWDAQSGETRWSPELCRIHGLDPSRPTPSFRAYVDELVVEGDRERLLEHARAAGREGTPVDFEMTVRRADGALRLLHNRARPIRDADGRLRRMEGISQDVTEQRAAERELREAQERFRAAFDAAAAGFVLISPAGEILEINDAAAAMTGRPMEELPGASAIELLHPEDRAPAMQAMVDAMEGGPRQGRFERRLVRPGGEIVHVVIATSLIRDPDGTPPTFCLQVLDISEQVRVTAERDEALRRSETDRRMLQATLDQFPAHVALKDLDGRFTFVNAAGAAFLGRPADDLVGLSNEDLFGAERSRGMRDIEAGIIGTGEPVSFEERVAEADGERVYSRVKFGVKDRDGQLHALGQMSWDITEERAAEREQAVADARFEVAFDRAPIGMGLAALDGRVLRSNAALEAITGRSAQEMAALAPFALIHPDDRARVERRYARIVDGDLTLEHRLLHADGRTVWAHVQATLVRDADGAPVHVLAQVQDVTEGGEYRAEGVEQPRIAAQMTWLQRIDRALEEDRLVLHAQPIVDLARNEIVQHEVLLRMLDEDGGLIAPGAFLPIAERFGTIGAIDRWVITRAIREMGRVREAGGRLALAVNVSGLSAGEPELLNLIERELGHAGIEPCDLVVELTETAAVADIPRARRFAEALRDLGCRFALDDFGAGFGSFYYLKHLPFDVLKIDGEFVKHAAANATDRLVISAVTEIARGLGKRTVAEFVPDDASIDLLLRHGVDFGQGHHLGRPRPLSELLAELDELPVLDHARRRWR